MKNVFSILNRRAIYDQNSYGELLEKKDITPTGTNLACNLKGDISDAKELLFHINETTSAGISSFAATLTFKENGQIIGIISATIPSTAAGTDQYYKFVDPNGYIEKADWVEMSFTFPSGTYTVYYKLKIISSDLATASSLATMAELTESTLIANSVVRADRKDSYNITVAGSNKIAKIVSPGFTLDDTKILLAYIKNSDDTKDYLPLTNLTVAANGSDYDVTFADKDANFAGTETVEIYTLGPERSYDDISDTKESAITNPGYSQWEDEAPISQTTGSTAEYINMDNFSHAVIDLAISAGSVTIGVSCDKVTAVGSITVWHTVPAGASLTSNIAVLVKGPVKWIRILPASATFTANIRKAYIG